MHHHETQSAAGQASAAAAVNAEASMFVKREGATQIKKEEGPYLQSKDALHVTPHFEFGAYAFSTEHEAVLDLHVQAASVCPEALTACRKPIDMVVVLDVSGSMSGAKLELCKSTLRFVIKELTPQDRMAIISFSDDARVEHEPVRVNDRTTRSLHAAIDRMHVRGGTHLSAGVLEGLRVLDTADPLDEHAVRTLLLLTDGQATSGITDPKKLAAAIKAMTQGSARGRGGAIKTCAFGYGADHSTALLRAVSEAGAGMYSYISTQEEVMASFGNCVGVLTSVVARDVELSVLVDATASHGARAKLLSPGYESSASSVANGNVQIRLNDICAHETKDLLLKLRLPSLPRPFYYEVGTVKLKYQDLLLGGVPVTITTPVLVLRPPATAPGVLLGNPLVVANKLRIIGVKALDHARALMQQKNRGQFLQRNPSGGGVHLNEAKTILEKAAATITEGMQTLEGGNRELAQAVLDDIEAAIASLHHRERQHTSAMLTSASASHTRQYSNRPRSSYSTPSMLTSVRRSYEAREATDSPPRQVARTASVDRPTQVSQDQEDKITLFNIFSR